jgi:hypothetical protein
MANPLLVFRLGFMKNYDGPGEISGGGSYVKRHRRGGEMWNFRPDGGRYYGYVMTRHVSGLDLNRIAPKQNGKWRANDELENVDIVFIAKQRGKNQAVVGWYKNATVFHKMYRKRPNPHKTATWKKISYVCEVAVENAKLLSEDERTEVVPFAPTHGAGYPGHSNVWYGSEDTDRSAKLLRKLRRYIGSDNTKTVPVTLQQSDMKSHRGVPKWLDRKTILAIEAKSMDATERYFAAAGYAIRRVHTDYSGWDMTAQKGNEILQLEVKGHIGDVIHFELTPNEYEKMQKLHKTYRICVVRRALESSTVEVYIPKMSRTDSWQLRDWAGKTVLSLGERVAARASELK